MICAQCSKPIKRSGFGSGRRIHHFRSCDADVCSWDCAVTRQKKITAFDPGLTSPIYWCYFNASEKQKQKQNSGSTPKPRLKRSSTERLLSTKYLLHESSPQIAMDILPEIEEEEETFEYEYSKTESFSIALFLAAALSLLCVVSG
tara:strand:- start:642 stop:1079 length:438 start_codon:yes stop_codon:yes gene_type:complete